MKFKKFAILVFTLSIIAITQIHATQDSDYYYKKANQMLISGDFNNAKVNYEAAISANPKFTEAYVGLGMVLKELGDNEGAYQSTVKALAIDPDYSQAYYNEGLILENLNKKQEAIRAYEKFLKEVPGAERFTDARQRIYKLKNK
ncbi:MAG: tetratricopeptide repeat protein [bacterium]